MNRCFAVILFAVPIAFAETLDWEPDGIPYEVVRAGRNHDDVEPVVPFEDSVGWHVECENAVAALSSSDQHRLFGKGSLKVVYRATKTGNGDSRPIVRIVPDIPVVLPEDANAVSIWCYGNNWQGKGPSGRADTPSVTIDVEFDDGAGGVCACELERVDHLEWFLSFRRIPKSILGQVRRGGMKLRSFRLSGGNNAEDREIFLTSFCAFKDEIDGRIAVAPRARRGVRTFEEEPQGVNCGQDVLPFPNSRRTILPSETKPDERLEFRMPKAPADSWDDLAFRWDGGAWIPLAENGGIYPVTARTNAQVSFHRDGNSLIADIIVRGGAVNEVRFGSVGGRMDADLVPVPYLSFQDGFLGRPTVLSFKQGETALFLSAHADWTQSAASELFAADQGGWTGPAVMGGVRYRPRTDGMRNDVYERFVWTISPDFSATLPTVPNPASPWKGVAGKGVWSVYGASASRLVDAAYWRRMKRLGLDHLIVMDHETMWRDGHESFTFRVDAAPGKGGDAAQRAYTRVMIDELGYVYGPYNNFTDFAPVNAYWNRDWVERDGDGQPIRAWYRCYSPKPIRAVELCERLAPVIQRKFGFNGAYCDVHTCVTPWSRCDYDARMPGAGTFAQTFYCYGEILLLQRKAWQGPVYSEGGCHWMYCGLVDGNYAQDAGYHFPENPWLVDFDVLRLHPLCCNFGMGSMGMFYGKDIPCDRWQAVDAFLAATAAFGHAGYLLKDTDMSLHSYAMIQAVSARYTQADADRIRYADESGRLMDTSEAISSGAYRLNRVAVRYSDGTVVLAHGGRSDSGEFAVLTPYGCIRIPPSGFAAISGDRRAIAISGLCDAGRADVAVSDEYAYMNGRGRWLRTAVGATDGLLFRCVRSETEETVVCRGKTTMPVELPYEASLVESFDSEGKSRGVVPFSITNGLSAFSTRQGDDYYRVQRKQICFLPSPEDVLNPFVRAEPGERTELPRFLPVPNLRTVGMILKEREPEPIDETCGSEVKSRVLTVGGIRRNGVFMHPPWRGRAKGLSGAVFQRFPVRLPSESHVMLLADVGKADGSAAGDGIWFKVEIQLEDKGFPVVVASCQVKDHRWTRLCADLSEWKGRRVIVWLVTDCGPAGDTDGDWGCWSNIRMMMWPVGCHQ